MRKRFADWLEKVSVGSLLVAIYQEKALGYVACVVALGLSVALTHRSEK